MFKFVVLFALAISAVAAQEATSSQEASPEPYSYGYQTDTHAASEQRDPSGKVTGFYTLVGDDGRERRVEYVADEAGFRAKIATNEVGTKSENPADVEVVASEPTPQQYVVYQQAPAVPQVARQQVVYQQRPQQIVAAAPRVTTTVQQPIRSQVAYVQQPQTAYGYYQPGYYGYGGYGSGYGTAYNSAYGYGYPAVGNYNNHLPSQYYRSISQSGTVAPTAYTVGGVNSVRYVSQPGVTTSGVRTVTYPAGGVSYGAATYGVPAASTAGSASSRSSSSLTGSSNYLVLQKREADDKKKSN